MHRMVTSKLLLDRSQQFTKLLTSQREAMLMWWMITLKKVNSATSNLTEVLPLPLHQLVMMRKTCLTLIMLSAALLTTRLFILSLTNQTIARHASRTTPVVDLAVGVPLETLPDKLIAAGHSPIFAGKSPQMISLGLTLASLMGIRTCLR